MAIRTFGPTKRAGCATLLALLVARPADAELFFDVGAHVTHFRTDIPYGPVTVTTDENVHLGIGARRRLAGGNDIGVRLEAEDVDSNAYLAFRMLDYRFNVGQRFGIGAFVGAARLDTGEAAFGWYFGTGFQIRQLLPAWDLGVDLRVGDSLQRDNVLPTDPPVAGQPRTDTFYDVESVSIYLSRRFGGRSRPGEP